MKRPDEGRLAPRVSAPLPPASTTKSGPTARPPGQLRPVRNDNALENTVRNAPPQRERAVDPRVASARSARAEARRLARERRALERDDIRRFTAHIRRRRQALLAIVVSAVALVIFVAVGTFTPLMALEKVTVVGTQRVDGNLIAQGLASQLGKPLPLVDARAVQATIARQPLVKSYAIQANPPHELIIRITERVPVAYLADADGFSMVDGAGVTIERVPTRDQDLPLIEVKGNSPTAKGFSAAVAVLAALPDDVRAQVDRVAASTSDDVTLFLNPTGSRVLWGGPEDSALKARVLEALVANYPLGSVAQYDVSAPNLPVVS